MRLAASPRRPNSADLNLGGQLFYVSELEQARRSLIAAAKIAGAATLAASAQQAVLRQAQRDELIDFLVRSLDEALRILKNEIRKRQPVAVAVSLPPSTIEVEMLERGILPDLVPAETASNSAQQFSAFLAQGARQLTAPDESVSRKLHIWAIPAEYAQKVAAFEAILLEQLPDSDHLNRR